jgi:cyclic beta-1,2-glucan synthetase
VPDIWDDIAPIRADLFGPERLEHHGLSLAAAQPVLPQAPSDRLPSVLRRASRLSKRLDKNASVLLSAYRFCAQAVRRGETISPAAEWLLDNFHLVEQQLRQIDDDLPPGYYRQLPKLADGPFVGYPRVMGLTWAYIAHTDSLISEPVLARYVKAYQQVQPLMIGELWAVAITLRIILVENMRRLAVQIMEGHRLRLEADALVDKVLGVRADDTTGSKTATMLAAVAPYEHTALNEIFAAQVAKRLRGHDPVETPLVHWLAERLRSQSSSIDSVVQNAQQRQGTSNVTMRNIVTSMRRVSELDWADFVEDVSLVDAHLRERSDFAAMDFATRNEYRTAIEILARGSNQSEIDVAKAALDLASRSDPPLDRDAGFALIGPGRGALEQVLGFKPSFAMRLRRGAGRNGLFGYLGSIALVTIAILVLALWYGSVMNGPILILLVLTGLLPAMEAGTAVVNLIVTRLVSPKRLPALDLAHGIPPEFRTLVAVPVLLRNEADLQEQIERLEVHHLSSSGGALHYALLSDGPDAATETTASDSALQASAQAAIDRLNSTYPSEDGARFFFLHRRRLWNEAEGVWMGWERKRGKLGELNRLLRGATDTSFLDHPALPADIRFVVTLDADTRLLRDTVRRMIGKMGHPLNRPTLDPETRRVTRGYGILQPRVTPSLPVGLEGSLFQQIYSSPGGIDAYAAATSDVYQDLFEEGSFTGKGIYDVDAFEAALRDRVPDNTMLSHDLFEGIFARAALTSDIEVVEDFPARHDVAMQRQHRWVRGDWQLVPWIFTRRTTQGGIPATGRWKMIDNLRRSLVAPFAMAALLAGWLMPMPHALGWTVAILGMLSLPRLLPLPFAILPGRAGITSRSHFAALAADTQAAVAQIVLNVVFLADTAAQMLDAIARTAYRLGISRRHLLEWKTAAQIASGNRPGLVGQVRLFAGGIVLGLGVCLLAFGLNPAAWPLILPFGMMWLIAPIIAHLISKPKAVRPLQSLPAADVDKLRHIARSTWHYFETFVSNGENFLPPDNFQEIPKPAVAHRTSPTNIGLYLLSIVTARDMGWISLSEAVTRLEQTLATMERMAKFRGHLYNWYDTTDLRVLDPAYVSSVDSGNLAGHLIAVAEACDDWQQSPMPDVRSGLLDTISLAGQALADTGHSDTELGQTLEYLAEAARRVDTDIADLRPLAERAVAQGKAAGATAPEVVGWTEAIQSTLAGHLADRPPHFTATTQLETIAERCRRLALDMDFAFLLDPEKKLLSIGFSVALNALDTNCYDLLASESRLGSLFAIAKGDIDTRHWFRLGRSATPVAAGSALISWSGSMFEYLMPSIVMRAPAGSVLEQTNRLIVARQRSYAQSLNIPWGISESSYNVRDLEMTYQYSNFGVPGLGLKRGLGENRVVAPYATGLAAMIDPAAAVENYARLESLGARGRFGFYEAVDFTRARLPEGTDHSIVRSYMAHHQGMTITAIANVLMDGVLRKRFHADLRIQAVELLLQERVPRDAMLAPPRASEVTVSATADPVGTSVLRRFEAPSAAAPTAHLLSNGRYGIMLTPTGSGFSRWRDIAITRWRADASRSGYGSFVFARDVASGQLWSAGVEPTQADADLHQAVFCEHHAAFTHKARSLSMHTEVVVSSEDDAEARRVTLTNTGKTAREIDLTSYAELVLAPPASDLAHPAFSKMFVVTDYLPELGVIIATRRLRSPQDPEVWAAHIAVVEGIEAAPIQIETDRARFIGRGRTIADAAMAKTPLSGTTGTVLDPIFSIRRRVRVPAGGRARVTFWTMVAPSPEALLDLVDRHRDPSAFGRAVTLSWTQGQVQLRHLGVTQSAACDFQRLAGVILSGDTRMRAPLSLIEAGAGPQSNLWVHGISGDLPIVVFRIDDAEDAARLQEVLAAHEYWAMRQLAVDLVILNERSTSYVQDLQTSIDAAVRAAQSRPKGEGNGAASGKIHSLRADLITTAARTHLLATARVVLVASNGSIGQQIDALKDTVMDTRISPSTPTYQPLATSTPPDPALPALEFFNGIGGFAEDGREYVTVLRAGQTTPAPWLNVVANPSFGFQVSADGSGHVWSENSRENQVTPWSNDPVTDPSGEAIYLHDLDTNQVWTPTALPIRTTGTYVARHGFGYSRFHHTNHGIASDMVQFLPLDASVKISRLRLHNTSNKVRNLSVTAYAEWVLGANRSATFPHLITSRDPETGAIFARNPFATAFADRVSFADFGQDTSSHTADRTEFLGQAGSMARPAGITHVPLSGRTGPALDPCAALQRRLTLAPGQTVDLVMLLGQAPSAEAAHNLIVQTRATDPEATLQGVVTHWTDLLTKVQVRSPDRAMDILLNGWLLYQTLACRIWARAGFYQASGAYGFRDQLQDGMALTAIRPDMTRAHLLRAASRQFPEGDVQHWWLPHSGQGVRTRISDDRVWLGYGVAQYIAVSGDEAILDEKIAFLEGPAVPPGAHDEFFQPTTSASIANLFEHCARGLDQAVAMTGRNGMPLIGTGDWNDGMNRVGEGGAGTSVWLGWLLIATINKFAPLADRRDPARAARWRDHAQSVRKAIEADGWDGAWYRRGTFDDGTVLGSASSQECRIDSIAQTWAVLSGAADKSRAATAMASMTTHLVRQDTGLALLFTPPFDASPLDPGYIKGYPPGLRENGGQYSHAAMWAVLAHARLGNGDAAGNLFALLNPVNHALTLADAGRYKVEPYVVAADVYSMPPHEGRGGWTWYTGSAGWMYRAGIEGLLGLIRAGDRLTLDPCFPKAWPKLEATVNYNNTKVQISILNPDGTGKGIVAASLNGKPLEQGFAPLTIPLAGGDHHLTVYLGHITPVPSDDRALQAVEDRPT